MKPYVYGPKFMWNIDSSVGKGGANSNVADVSFLQWYYTLAANFHLTTPENQAVYRAVKITGSCTGRDNDPLVAAIFAQQRGMNHPFIDGKVSVVTGSGKVSDKAFFLIRLEARFAVMYPDAWPRLDRIPGCPSSVLDIARYAVPNLAEIQHG
jgi:hypothetical protein